MNAGDRSKSEHRKSTSIVNNSAYCNNESPAFCVYNFSNVYLKKITEKKNKKLLKLIKQCDCYQKII